MENIGAVILVIVVMVVYWGGTALYRRHLANKIANAMAKGDQETYQKLLFSKRVLFLLNPNSICLMRGGYCIASNRQEEAEKYLKMVQVKKLPFEQKINYYQTMTMLALNKKDKELYGKIQESLKGMKDQQHSEWIQAMVKENEINFKLYFDFDATVIDELNEQREKNEGAARGMICMSLAKAYHLNKQKKESTALLKEAQSLLKGTLYEELIVATLKDPSIMD